MTTQSMNHQQALETMAVERYLLREMTPEERRIFEEHYLECAACLEAVTFGTDFFEAGREVAREEQHARTTVPVPHWRERLLPVFGWLRPAPALAFALLICLGGLNVYQLSLVHKQKSVIAELTAPRQEFRYTIPGDARSGLDQQKIITVPRKTQLSFRFEFMPGGQLTPYRADILSQNDTLKYSLPLSVAQTGDSVSFSIPAEALGPGTYALVIRRHLSDGTSKDLERHFVLQFMD